MSDHLLINIHKYLVSEDAMMYDPLLGKMLTKLMKKFFALLLKKIKEEFGEQIVYANFTKIVINTGKHTI
jgi:ribosomal protein S7